ncbi:MAG: cystathionine gamma-synthase [Candidatus Sericytochromatia bacterium]|uniref:Cystathionine gamma-synthase n=1 Tax=Candidatus Tanganyikabacteria bacterium TaxID=2961651 RepID=A0A937X5K7_9BACT|nr:cystathionine gamma-synthase [Candidatus Tanganyikabacteria bacterium]
MKLSRDNGSAPGFQTRAIHVGQGADPTTGATILPIYQTSTYTQEDVGVHKGFDYSRTANPTRKALEQCLASLENADYGLCFSSGMGATDAVLKLLSGGDHVVVSDDVYGGTYRLFERVLARFGLSFTWVDASVPENVAGALQPNTRMIWAETPTNPLLKVIDLPALAQIARDHGPILAVDNTFATPYLQNPLDLGADVVVHSTTKYIGGHSDVVGGFAATRNEETYQTLKFHQNAIGAVPSPFDAWLTLRGVKTLALRMREHENNARAVAEALAAHPLVERVYYPGLASHPQHELARRQMRGFGGIVSFAVKGDLDLTRTVAKGLKIFSLAESLGGVESLCCHPAVMTHASIPRADREARGVTDALLRLSCGIEESDDLVADVVDALDRARVAASL